MSLRAKKIMKIDGRYVMFCCEFSWNSDVNKSHQRHAMSCGKVGRKHCDLFIHHMNMPRMFYPSTSTGFTAVLTNDCSGLASVVSVVLGTQYQTWDNSLLPFRAKVTSTNRDGFTYLVVGFTGIRELWIANYQASKKRTSTPV